MRNQIQKGEKIGFKEWKIANKYYDIATLKWIENKTKKRILQIRIRHTAEGSP